MNGESLLRRDRAVVIAALVAAIAASWAYLLAGAGMGELGTMPLARAGWSIGYFAIMFAMWAVMMVAMMLPGAAPMILLHMKVGQRRLERGALPVATGHFVLGYVAVWTAFSLGATMLQWAFDEMALLAPMMETNARAVAAGLLVAAGLYQLTPLKQSCLRHCRSPLDFIISRWREGRAGSFLMGVEHGAYCLGCCWLLMLLLFVGGVMSLLWIAGLAAYVLIEKTVPAGPWFARATGLALIASAPLLVIA